MLSAGDGWGMVGRGRSQPEVARTTDGGTTWDVISPPKVCGFGEPGGPSLDNAWLATSVTHGVRERGAVTVCHSADGGVIWHRVAHFHSIGQAGTPQFVDERHGWLVASVAGGMHSPGDLRLYRTDDSGQHWRQVAARVSGLYGGRSSGGLPSTCDGDISFTDSHTGWYVGGCAQGRAPAEAEIRNRWADDVAVTHDGGVTWRVPQLPHPSIGGSRAGCPMSAACVYQPVRVDGDLVELAAGGFGVHRAFLYRSVDGGRRWHVERLPLANTNVGTADGRHLIQLDPRHRLVYVSGDAGRSWRRTGRDLPAPAFEGPDVTSRRSALVFLLHDRPLFRTRDGGRHWSQVAVRVTKPAVRLCRSDDLAGRFLGGGMGTGNVFGSVVMWNRSDSRCQVAGVPRFAAYFADGRRDRRAVVNRPSPVHLTLPADMPAFVPKRGLRGYAVAVLMGPERDDAAQPDGLCRDEDKLTPATLVLTFDGAVVRVRNHASGQRNDVSAVYGCHGRVLLEQVDRGH